MLEGGRAFPSRQWGFSLRAQFPSLHDSLDPQFPLGPTLQHPAELPVGTADRAETRRGSVPGVAGMRPALLWRPGPRPGGCRTRGRRIPERPWQTPACRCPRPAASHRRLAGPGYRARAIGRSAPWFQLGRPSLPCGVFQVFFDQAEGGPGLGSVGAKMPPPFGWSSQPHGDMRLVDSSTTPKLPPSRRPMPMRC